MRLDQLFCNLPILDQVVGDRLSFLRIAMAIVFFAINGSAELAVDMGGDMQQRSKIVGE